MAACAASKMTSGTIPGCTLGWIRLARSFQQEDDRNHAIVFTDRALIACEALPTPRLALQGRSEPRHGVPYIGECLAVQLHCVCCPFADAIRSIEWIFAVGVGR